MPLTLATTSISLVKEDQRLIKRVFYLRIHWDLFAPQKVVAQMFLSSILRKVHIDIKKTRTFCTVLEQNRVKQCHWRCAHLGTERSQSQKNGRVAASQSLPCVSSIFLRIFLSSLNGSWMNVILRAAQGGCYQQRSWKEIPKREVGDHYQRSYRDPVWKYTRKNSLEAHKSIS